MNDRTPRVLAYTTAGTVSPNVAVAASRAGALGVIDLGAGVVDCREALDRASRWLAGRGRRFGIRLPAPSVDRAFLVSLPENLDSVVVWGPLGEVGPRAFEAIRAAGRKAFAEVTSREDAVTAVSAGYSRLIATGREAGGYGGDDASSDLLRTILGVVPEGTRVWVRGGIGPAEASTCAAAGAAGVVVDGALVLTRESKPSAEFRGRIAGWDGTETTRVGRFRAWVLAGRDELRDRLERLDLDAPGWPAVLDDLTDSGRERLWLIGQDVALADGLARQYVTVGGVIQAVSQAMGVPGKRRRRHRPSDVAIVGMSAIAPGAENVGKLWGNTLAGVDAITEVGPDRWDWRLYYDADPKAPDKITSRWGGFVPDVPFDPLRYGMPPASLPSIEPLHLLLLEAVRAAMDDAGYRDRDFPRERTAVVLGAGGGAAQLAMGYALRSYLPLLDTVVPGLGTEALARCGPVLPEWTEDSFAGILLNVAAGRVANRFDLGGANYTVDAACGSSLAAAALAVRELESGAADVVLLAGADTVQNPFTYLAFSKTQAFSPNGRCRPFDASADGIVISEGVAVLVLKRLADAERDGDKIYAVLKGLGASSDGRAKGLTAPRAEGQTRALRRAYDKAGVSASTVGYVEAHGTGTAAGDLAEVRALTEVFEESGTGPQSCALGSLKSQVGHTKCAAGLLGLINASLALAHRVFPPTIGVETLNPRAGLDRGPFHVSTQTRPWLRPNVDQPRRAGVSAFGFGGTNFHAVLEAYEGNTSELGPTHLDRTAELLVFRASDRQALADETGRLIRAIDAGNAPPVREIAHSVSHRPASGPAVLAVVAATTADLKDKLLKANRELTSPGGRASWADPSGVACSDRAPSDPPRIAFLFPGQGAQSPGMLGDLAVAFPEILDGIESFDQALAGRRLPPVGPLMYPAPARDDATAGRQSQALAAADVAQPALGASGVGLLRLLDRLGLRADALAGHSYGELVALHAAGTFTLDDLAELSVRRGRFLLDAVGPEPGAMAALRAAGRELAALLEGEPDVVAANLNGPTQTVISGPRDAIARVGQRARERGVAFKPLNTACAFHSPLVADAEAPLAALAASLGPRKPSRAVFSNVTAEVYPADPDAVARQIGRHAVSPVRFAETVQALHDSGVRVFLEVGPGGVLPPLVGAILGDRPHMALGCDGPGASGVTGLLKTLARLAASGVPFDPRPLTEGRCDRFVSWDAGRFEGGADPLPPSAWLVNGNRARPAFGPEPPRFGPGAALPVTARTPVMADINEQFNINTLNETLAARPAAPDAVFDAFQASMRSFLEVQRSTMLAYLGGRTAGPPAEIQETPAAKPDPAAEPPRQAPDVERRLLEVVRDRTGYPLEMLRLDLDLEADLGIDSIKRVEILGTLRDEFPNSDGGPESDLMDQLSRSRTLGAIVERFGKVLRAEAPGNLERTRPATNGRLHHNNGSHAVALLDPPKAARRPARPPERVRPPSAVRSLLRASDAPHNPGDFARFAPGGLVVITDDRRGVASLLAQFLAERGMRALLVRHAAGPIGPADPNAFTLDLGDPSQVARLRDHAAGIAPVVALVHAATLAESPGAGLDPGRWADRFRPEVRGLFLLAKAFAGDLDRSARNGGSALIAATGFGGGFASVGPVAPDFFAGQGGVSGLVKTLGREWPEVRTRVVDFDPTDAPETLAARLLDELYDGCRRPEVGYIRGRRQTLRPFDAPNEPNPGGPSLQAGDPVIVTGGARGITAAVAVDLARRWRPTLLLLGSSPPPDESTDPAEPAESRSALLHRLRRSGSDPGPAELERLFRRSAHEREARANLHALREAGSAVEYAQADVRDRAALGAVLADWRRRFGPPAGLIHGAGVIADKLVVDKSPESFDRVIDVKLGGAVNLAGLLDPDAATLKFAAFFSSVAGRFGNRGQGDYAAANDALNKLALWLDARWPGRIVSLNWGPWAEIGMVSDLADRLGRQGFGLIDPLDGSARLGDELAYGRKGEVEVVIAGALGDLLDGSTP